MSWASFFVPPATTALNKGKDVGETALKIAGLLLAVATLPFWLPVVVGLSVFNSSPAPVSSAQPKP
jgi:hypothetical protein